jgi:Tol biopolymer transport system component
MAGGFQRGLVRVDRYGRETPIAVEPRGYRFPKYSPDGSRIAVTVDPRPSSIWLVDPARGSAVPLTTTGIHSIHPIWAADGTRIAFLQQGVSWMPATGGADPRPALITPAGTTRGFVNPFVWTRDDRFVATETRGASWDAGSDIVTFGLGDSAKTRIVSTGARNRAPALSPDGRWLAYASDLSGAMEIYVRPFGRAGEDVLVSSGGGVEPRWAAGGTELFYRSGTRIMAVPVRTGPEFEVTGTPQALFGGAYDWSQDDNWDVSPDGSFILVQGDPASGTQLRAVFNWFEEVKALGRK